MPDAAILVTDYAPYGGSVIALVVVDKAVQQRGMAGALLSHSLAALQRLGHSQCCARITQGNTASERLFLGWGFIPEPSQISTLRALLALDQCRIS